MPSDNRSLQRAMEHVARIKTGEYPVVVEREGQHRIQERPWADVPERSKLAILQDAVDWEGVTNRDKAHILLSTIDPGKITDTQRNRLIDAAVGPDHGQEREGRER
jgi:hypothetical protein